MEDSNRCTGQAHSGGRSETTPDGRVPLIRHTRLCRCGTCRTCADNAKWERIFREKFEDPDYYKPRAFSAGCPLGVPVHAQSAALAQSTRYR